MKIYNKKLFAFGVFIAVLGVVNVIGRIVTQELEVEGTVLGSLVFLFGAIDIRKGRSAQRSKEEKDERNQLAALKSKSRN